MNIALIKIRCAGFPNLRFGMQSLNRLPRAVADALGVLLGGNEQDLQLVVMRFFVDLQNNASNSSSIQNDAVGLAIGRVDTTLDGFARDDLSVKIHVIVTLTEFVKSTVLECPLIVKNKLFAVVRAQRHKLYFCFFHNNILSKINLDHIILS